MSDAHRLNLRIFSILAACEVWSVPRPGKPNPIALVFYVPEHHADEVRALIPPAPPEAAGETKHLRLMD